MFTPLKDLLPRAANHHNMHRQLTAAHVCQLYRRLVIASKNENLEMYSSPRSFKDGQLLVAVSDPGIAQEVFIRKADFIAKINQALGKTIVTELRTIVISQPAPEADQ